jgi:hypothetical protein
MNSNAVGIFLIVFAFILFCPKRKKPKLTLHRGGKYDPDTPHD